LIYLKYTKRDYRKLFFLFIINGRGITGSAMTKVKTFKKKIVWIKKKCPKMLFFPPDGNHFFIIYNIWRSCDKNVFTVV